MTQAIFATLGRHKSWGTSRVLFTHPSRCESDVFGSRLGDRYQKTVRGGDHSGWGGVLLLSDCARGCTSITLRRVSSSFPRWRVFYLSLLCHRSPSVPVPWSARHSPHTLHTGRQRPSIWYSIQGLASCTDDYPHSYTAFHRNNRTIPSPLIPPPPMSPACRLSPEEYQFSVSEIALACWDEVTWSRMTVVVYCKRVLPWNRPRS